MLLLQYLQKTLSLFLKKMDDGTGIKQGQGGHGLGALQDGLLLEATLVFMPFLTKYNQT